MLRSGRYIYNKKVQGCTHILLTLSHISMPVSLSPEGRRALDELSRQTAERNVIPGFVYAASSVDGEIYLTSGGTKLVDDPTSAPVDPDTVFWICSMTKMLGHLAALQLIERGQLSQDTPVSDYFEEFKNPIVVGNLENPSPNPQPAKTVLRVKHLLNFTSGLVYYPISELMSELPETYTHSYHEDEDPYAAFFKLVKGPHPALPLEFEPGTNFGYGYSSDVLGFIVEKISGKTLEEYFQENIFKPLGLKMSFYLTPELQQHLLPLVHRTGDGKLEAWANQAKVIEREVAKVKIHFAGVGVYASLRDYLAVLRHILQIHAGTAQSPIAKRETILSMFEPTLNEKSANTLEVFINHPNCQWSTALGVASKDWAEGRKRGSAFWSGWANTHFHMDPQTGVAAIFGSQLHPAFDAELWQVYTQFERTLYDNLQT
ncbi:beta-lactamase/transpeptidase-like protein [Panaeolus papilionaceus]|nr:beta-lactamase/transpeptidase-like protein [Panaeolus papilionaceus]